MLISKAIQPTMSGGGSTSILLRNICRRSLSTATIASSSSTTSSSLVSCSSQQRVAALPPSKNPNNRVMNVSQVAQSQQRLASTSSRRQWLRAPYNDFDALVKSNFPGAISNDSLVRKVRNTSRLFTDAKYCSSSSSFVELAKL